jgi:hypothetical protein
MRGLLFSFILGFYRAPVLPLLVGCKVAPPKAAPLEEGLYWLEG